MKIIKFFIILQFVSISYLGYSYDKCLSFTSKPPTEYTTSEEICIGVFGGHAQDFKCDSAPSSRSRSICVGIKASRDTLFECKKLCQTDPIAKEYCLIQRKVNDDDTCLERSREKSGGENNISEDWNSCMGILLGRKNLLLDTNEPDAKVFYNKHYTKFLALHDSSFDPIEVASLTDFTRAQSAYQGILLSNEYNRSIGKPNLYWPKFDAGCGVLPPISKEAFDLHQWTERLLPDIEYSSLGKSPAEIATENGVHFIVREISADYLSEVLEKMSFEIRSFEKEDDFGDYILDFDYPPAVYFYAISDKRHRQILEPNSTEVLNHQPIAIVLNADILSTFKDYHLSRMWPWGSYAHSSVKPEQKKRFHELMSQISDHDVHNEIVVKHSVPLEKFIQEIIIKESELDKIDLSLLKKSGISFIINTAK